MIKEKENNNSKIRADEIIFDEDIVGSLSSNKDIDVFKIYVDEAMVLRLYLDPPKPSVANSWDIIIKNEDGDILQAKSNMRPSRNDRDGEYLFASTEESGWIYIYVKQDESGQLRQDVDYSFSLKSYPGRFMWEYESNNTFSDATRLKYDDDNLKNIDNIRFSNNEGWINGYLYLPQKAEFSSNYDKDFYRFNLQNQYDTVKFSFKTPYEHWSNIDEIYDLDGDEWIVEFYHEDDLNNPIGEKTFPALLTKGDDYEFSVKDTGTFFVKIYQNDFNLVDTSRYEFKLTFSSSGNTISSEDPLDGTNIIIPSGDEDQSAFWVGGVYNAKQGDDIYILSNSISKNAKFTISDKLGDNVIQLVDGFSFVSSEFYSNKLELNLTNNRKITIENADLFTYEIGGNETTGTSGTKLNYSNFANELGVNSIPSGSSSRSGNGSTVSGKKFEDSNSTNNNSSTNGNDYSDNDVSFFTNKFDGDFRNAKWNYGKDILTITYSFPSESLRGDKDIRIERQFTIEEKNAINEMIALWDNQLETIDFEFIENDKLADITFGLTKIDGFGDTNFNTLGSNINNEFKRLINYSIIQIDSDDANENDINAFKKVILHELGHSLGLGHFNSSNSGDFISIMFPKIDESGYDLSNNFTLSNFDKAMIRAYYREDTIESFSGGIGDDDETLSSGDNIWTVGPGYDQIDGGLGIDTVVIPNDARITRSVDTNGSTRYTGIKGEKFLYIRLKNGSGELSDEYSVLWNFEKIEYRDQVYDINSFSDNGLFNIGSYSSKVLNNQIVEDDTINTIDLSEYFYTINEGGSLAFSVSSTSEDLSDQIILNGNILSLKSGSEGSAITSEITIIIKEVNSIASQGLAPEITKTFSVTMKDEQDSVSDTVSENNDYFSNEKSQSGPNIIEFSNSSSDKSKVLNHTSQNDIIVHTGHAGTLRGLAGDDIYIISSLIPKAFSGTIVDTAGNNIIEITDNTLITKMEFSGDSMRITIDKDKVLIINGATNFSYRLGANILGGDTSEDLTYSQFFSIFEDYFIENLYVKSSSLGESAFNIINISDKNSEIINATDSSDDFRYRFEQISSKGVSLENFTNILIEGFDKNNDKITLVNVNGENLHIDEFKDLSDIDISGNSFDNNTVIYFSPDSSGASGSLEIAGIYDTSLEDISLSILSDDNLSSSNETGFTLANELNSSKPILSSFNTEDSKGTLNLNAYDNIIILTGSYTYRGLDGDDLYFISNMMTDNAKSTIVDSSGNNTIQIPDNTYIDSIAFANDSMRIVLETSKTITINGADEFNYNIGGNITSGDEGETLSYSELALTFGVSDVLNIIDGDAELGTSDLYII